MEPKKKKNGADRSRRIIFSGVGVMWVILLIFLLSLFIDAYGYRFPSESWFNPTASAIVATNQHVATLIAQTDVAVTEQFIMTRTALP
jgi:hypothetical protein